MESHFKMTLDVIPTLTTFAVIATLNCSGTTIPSKGTTKWPIMEDIVTVEPSSSNHTGTVIFLHGLGQNGSTTRRLIQEARENASFPHLKIIYPTAPLRPYTMHGGNLSRVWFDRQQIDPHFGEPLDSINAMAEELDKLILEEYKSGIPLDRIVVGGFAMGGVMSLHLGFRFQPEVAGVFCLSAFGNYNSTIYRELSLENKTRELPTLFQSHGKKENLLHLSWALETFKQLSMSGVGGVFHTVSNGRHKLEKANIDLLFDWINEVLPNT